MEYVVTITDVRYEGVDEVVQVSPLGVEQTAPIVLDNVVLTVDVGELVGHLIVAKPEAVGTRMMIYGLDTEQDALEAIAREPVFAWSGLPPETADKVGMLGGVDSRITVLWAAGAQIDPDDLALIRSRAQALIADRTAPDA